MIPQILKIIKEEKEHSFFVTVYIYIRSLFLFGTSLSQSLVQRFVNLFKMKFLILPILLVGFAAQQAYAQTCHMREIDLCIAIGMFHYQSNGIPADEEKVDEWCETFQEVTDCMGNFTAKCLSPLQRELMELMNGADEIARQLCTAGSEIRATYLEHSECLADGAESDEFKSQMKDVQVVIETMFDVPFKQRFPLMCCGFRRFHENVEDMTARRCGDNAVNMLRNVLKMITTDLPEIVCQPYDHKSEQCQGLLPPTGTPSKGAENKSQIGKLMDTVFGNL